jgi:hypothetical protein
MDNINNPANGGGVICPVDNSMRSGQNTEGVAEGQTDAAITDIQCQNASYVNLPLHQFFHQTQCFVELGFIFTARLGKVRPATTTTASHL